MGFKGVAFLETAEEEVARLSKAPVGSASHDLAALPVNITGNLEGRIIALPNTHGQRIVVVASDQRSSGNLKERHSGSWECVVVASDNENYPVGGYKIIVATAALVGANASASETCIDNQLRS